MNYSVKIIQAMKDQNISTPEDLSKFTGLCMLTISRLLVNDHRCRIDDLMTVTECLNVEIDFNYIG